MPEGEFLFYLEEWNEKKQNWQVFSDMGRSVNIDHKPLIERMNGLKILFPKLSYRVIAIIDETY